VQKGNAVEKVGGCEALKDRRWGDGRLRGLKPDV
jgi:hypothetical protein